MRSTFIALFTTSVLLGGCARQPNVSSEQQLRKQQAELEKAARETRLSLQAIEKNQQAHDLRQKLTARLKDGQRMDGVTKELVEGEMTIGELEVRDPLREVRLVVAPMATVRK